MSKFHKTLNKFFVVNETYVVSSIFGEKESLLTKYERGHLHFVSNNVLRSISGGDIRDKRVIIKNKNGETFTINGWISE